MGTERITFTDHHLKDIYPVDIGYQHCKSNYSYHYRESEHYIIHYIKSGKGRLYLDNISYDINEEEFFIIKKGESVKYTADENDPWHYIWITFDGEFAKMFSNCKSVYTKDVGDIFTNMMSVFKNFELGEEFLASQLMLLYVRIFSTSLKKNYAELSKNYIDTNFSKKILVSDIASSLNLNRKYLSKIFKEKNGISIKKYITKVKMKNAKNFIRNGFNVKETAEMLGYEDQFNFSKSFKVYVGCSPSEYKLTLEKSAYRIGLKRVEPRMP